MKIAFGKLAFPKKGAVVLGVMENQKMSAMAAEADTASGGY
jgi:hypothetical protein